MRYGWHSDQKSKISEEVLQNGAIFDGFPRNLEQAKTLSKILDGYNYKAVFFKLDTEKLVERLGNRRVTKDGKYIYNKSQMTSSDKITLLFFHSSVCISHIHIVFTYKVLLTHIIYSHNTLHFSSKIDVTL